jgi:hypothetical protein
MTDRSIARKDRQYKLTAERARELFSYDPIKGELRWRVAPKYKPSLCCQLAGAVDRGYRKVMADGERHYAHRIAVLIVTGKWPRDQVDHKSTDNSDMTWENIRPATPSQNASNQKIRSTNTSGFKGVNLHACGKWAAKITHQYQQIYLGLFDTPQEAHSAYCEAARALHGEFARVE